MKKSKELLEFEKFWGNAPYTPYDYIKWLESEIEQEKERIRATKYNKEQLIKNKK